MKLAVFGTLILTFCSSVGLMLRYAPFETIVSPRQKKALRICYPVFSAVHLLVLFAGIYVWKIEGVFMYLRYGMLIYAGLMTLVNILIIPGKIREHLFVFGTVYTCKFLIFSIPNYIITIIHGLPSNQYVYVILVIYTILLVAAYVPLRRLLCSTVTPFLQTEDSTIWNTAWFIPIAMLGTRLLSVGGEHNEGGLLQLTSSSLYALVLIFMCVNISRSHRQLAARRTLEEQLLNQKLYYGELQARVEETRKIRHDLKHHVAAILHFLELNDRESAQTYSMELIDRVDGGEPIPHTGNTAADGVFYRYMQQAVKHQAELKIMGTIRSHGIADMDLCILLGNALDNALAGCLTIPDNRSIQVISHSENRLLSIMVRNTFDGIVEHDGDMILSRKRDGAPGVGIYSMQTVCKRYGGSMEIQYDENTFTVMLALPLGE